MTVRSLLIRSTLFSVFAFVAAAPEKADAFWNGYYGGYQPYYAGYSGWGTGTYTAGYAPSYGWGYRPLLQRRIDRLQQRTARLSYRANSFGAYPIYTAGYAGSACGCGTSACCGTCGITTNYVPSCGGCNACGCDPCGCSTGACGSNGCASSDCPSGTCGSTIVNSVPTEAEPTPVRSKSKEEKPSTFGTDGGDRTDSDLDNRRRPSDGFGPNPNTNRNPGAGEALPDDFSSPIRTNPTNPVNPRTDSGTGFDFLNPVEPANPGTGTGGDSGTVEQFRPAPASGPTELPPDDEASLPSRTTRKLSTIESPLQTVQVERRRTQVRARYRTPQIASRSFDFESIITSNGTQVAAID